LSLAFVFPGQGSQYVGMGKDIADNFLVAQQIFVQADEVLGSSLSELCFIGPEEELNETTNTQPALLTTSIACLEVLKEKGVRADLVAGHSLGEYSALVAAGVLDFPSALKLVRLRGQFMQEAVPADKGAMAAILGLSRPQVKDICRKSSSEGIVSPAAFNCPGQIVIAGEVKAIEKAVALASEAGARRAVKLAVSVPSHSPLMQSAVERFKKEMDRIDFPEPQIPVVANFNASPLTSSAEIKEALSKQLISPLLWEDSVIEMVKKGETFIEIGPSRVLSGLIKRIDRRANIFNVEDRRSLEKTLHSLENRE